MAVFVSKLDGSACGRTLPSVDRKSVAKCWQVWKVCATSSKATLTPGEALPACSCILLAVAAAQLSTVTTKAWQVFEYCGM
jgi:hypothetical protein